LYLLLMLKRGVYGGGIRASQSPPHLGFVIKGIKICQCQLSFMLRNIADLQSVTA
jgi:hypothetical protein